MMKKNNITKMLVTVVLTLSIAACSNIDSTTGSTQAGSTHEHTWAEATCTDPKTCTVCGETEGTSLGGHDYDFTAEKPTCNRCGYMRDGTLEEAVEYLLPFSDETFTYEYNEGYSCISLVIDATSGAEMIDMYREACKTTKSYYDTAKNAYSDYVDEGIVASSTANSKTEEQKQEYISKREEMKQTIYNSISAAFDVGADMEYPTLLHNYCGDNIRYFSVKIYMEDNDTGYYSYIDSSPTFGDCWFYCSFEYRDGAKVFDVLEYLDEQYALE